MRIVHRIDELRGALADFPGLAFVPTMGNLHDGHIALMRLARDNARHVAASIFVNRLQFAPGEDFDGYPRTFDADCARLRAASVDLLFAPDDSVLYPESQGFVVEPPAIAGELEGRFRPRFFHGVATVVLKLLNCVQPRIAVFGKKDYQQLHIVRVMVRQLNLPVDVLAGETVREADGLAMSSRNGYLCATERAEAPRLHRILQQVKDGMDCKDAVRELAAAGWKPDYVEVRRRRDLALPEGEERELVVLAAARLGRTRLIDNLEFQLG